MIYPAFSGGIGSTVLLHITRNIYPNMIGVFCNTGMELDSLVDFVNNTPGIITIRPEHSYSWACKNHGYPVVSKEVSKNISRARNTKSEEQRNLRLYGGINPTSGKVQKPGVPKKYHYLMDAPFPISDKCCDILKKNPFKKYNKKTGMVPMTGEMACDSNKRTMTYLKKGGCNCYSPKEPKSTPLGFWTQQDVLQYILDYKVPYCSAYGDIVKDEKTGLLVTTGERHTGCVGCMFALYHEKPPGRRFILLKEKDPVRWDMVYQQVWPICRT